MPARDGVARAETYLFDFLGIPLTLSLLLQPSFVFENHFIFDLRINDDQWQLIKFKQRNIRQTRISALFPAHSDSKSSVSIKEQNRFQEESRGTENSIVPFFFFPRNTFAYMHAPPLQIWYLEDMISRSSTSLREQFANEQRGISEREERLLPVPVCRAWFN